MLKWLKQWRACGAWGAWGRIDEGAVHTGGDEDALRLHRALESGASRHLEGEGEASGRMRARVESSIRAGSAKRFKEAPAERDRPPGLRWSAALAAIAVIAGVTAAVWIGRSPGVHSMVAGPPAQKSERTIEGYMKPTIALESANRMEQRLARESRALASDVKRLASGMRSRMPAGLGTRE